MMMVELVWPGSVQMTFPDFLSTRCSSNRAPYVVEKIFDFGLTLPGIHGAAGEPILQ